MGRRETGIAEVATSAVSMTGLGRRGSATTKGRQQQQQQGRRGSITAELAAAVTVDPAEGLYNYNLPACKASDRLKIAEAEEAAENDSDGHSGAAGKCSQQKASSSSPVHSGGRKKARKKNPKPTWSQGRVVEVPIGDVSDFIHSLVPSGRIPLSVLS